MKDEQADQIVEAVVRRLRERREQLGMSVNRVAEKAGMSHVGILQIESGQRSPMLRNVIKIAAALDMAPEDLLAGD